MLHFACVHGHPDVVALLIEQNCDIDLRDSDNSTALIKASQYEREECIAMLLEHGADPNAMDSSGNTALHYAVWHNNMSMAAKLLAHHADITIRNEDSFTPLKLAQLKNHDNLAKLLENKEEKIEEVDELDRSSKKTSDEKEEVKEQGNLVFDKEQGDLMCDKEQGNLIVDLNELISASEGNLEDCEMISFDTILHLIEQLRRQSKDSGSLVQVWFAVSSYKRSMEIKKLNCELITEENESLRNDIIVVQKERSQIEFEKTKLRAEIHNMRLTAENADLEAAIKLQSKENEQLPRTPSEELYHSLTQSLDEMKRKTSELDKEIASFENLCTMKEEDSDAHKNGEFSDSSASSTTLCENEMVFKLREELESIETKLQQAQSHWKCLNDENNALQQKSAEMAAAQEKCEMLERKIQQHEEIILSLKTHMDQNMVECSEVEKHRKAIERQHRCQVMEEINIVNRLLHVTTVICHVL